MMAKKELTEIKKKKEKPIVIQKGMNDKLMEGKILVEFNKSTNFYKEVNQKTSNLNCSYIYMDEKEFRNLKKTNKENNNA